MNDTRFPTGNENVRFQALDVLSDNWYTLRRATFDYRDSSGIWSTQQREAYDRGNGATLLLFNRSKRTVVLTRQFRVPTYLNGNHDGMLIETPAGLLDDDDPETAMRREAEEETGYRVGDMSRILDLYMSPGSVTERLAFFVAECTDEDRRTAGGGVVDEGESIEVLEPTFEAALDMVANGEIRDAKTVLLLQWAQLHVFNLSDSHPGIVG